MAVHASTGNPSGLLDAIKKAIKDGKVATWEIDKDGDIVHAKTDNNVQTAFFRPKVQATSLRFAIITLKKDPPLDAFSYAYHHGKLVQMLLNHFSEQLEGVSSSPWSPPAKE